MEKKKTKHFYVLKYKRKVIVFDIDIDLVFVIVFRCSINDGDFSSFILHSVEMTFRFNL